MKEKYGGIDVLINNAGCMVNTREVDTNGLEKNFATNTLGTHLLTSALVPLLSQYVLFCSICWFFKVSITLARNFD